MSDTVIETKRRSFKVWFLRKSAWLRWIILFLISIYPALNIIDSKIAIAPADLPQTKTQTISLPVYVDIVEKAEIKNPVVQINRIGINEYWEKTKEYKVHLASRIGSTKSVMDCQNCFILQHIAMADTSATMVQYAEEIIDHIQTMNLWVSYYPSYKTENNSIIIQYALGRSTNYYGVCIITAVFIGVLMLVPNWYLTGFLKKIYLYSFKR